MIPAPHDPMRRITPARAPIWPMASFILATGDDPGACMTRATMRPTASFIIAQGNALGTRPNETIQPEGLPHLPARQRSPWMRQAFSLQPILHPLPRALPWAMMREAVGLRIHGPNEPRIFATAHRPSVTPASTMGPMPPPMRPTASRIIAQGNALGTRPDKPMQPEGLPHLPACQRSPRMRQALSLRFIPRPFPRALPWAMLREAVGLRMRGHDESTRSDTTPPANVSTASFPSAMGSAPGARMTRSPMRPTASFIIAQGNALGTRPDKPMQPEGRPHLPARQRSPRMRQAFSLRPVLPPSPRALPWAMMREAVGLQNPTPPAPLPTRLTKHLP